MYDRVGGRGPLQEVTHMVQHAPDVLARPLSPDSVAVQFDDTRLISDAGLLLCATLADVSPPCSSGAGQLLRVTAVHPRELLRAARELRG